MAGQQRKTERHQGRRRSRMALCADAAEAYSTIPAAALTSFQQKKQQAALRVSPQPQPLDPSALALQVPGLCGLGWAGLEAVPGSARMSQRRTSWRESPNHHQHRLAHAGSRSKSRALSRFVDLNLLSATASQLSSSGVRASPHCRMWSFKASGGEAAAKRRSRSGEATRDVRAAGGNGVLPGLPGDTVGQIPWSRRRDLYLRHKSPPRRPTERAHPTNTLRPVPQADAES